MKKILLTVLTIHLLIGTQAQEPCYNKVTDKFTDVTKWQWPSGIILQQTVLTTAAGGPKYFKTNFTLHFHNEEIVSVDESSTCTFLFTDKTKMIVKHAGGYNLNGNFTITFYDYKLGGGQKQLKEFLSKKVESIRLSGFSRSRDINLSESESNELFEKVNCLYNGWKNERSK